MSFSQITGGAPAACAGAGEEDALIARAADGVLRLVGCHGPGVSPAVGGRRMFGKAWGAAKIRLLLKLSVNFSGFGGHAGAGRGESRACLAARQRNLRGRRLLQGRSRKGPAVSQVRGIDARASAPHPLETGNSRSAFPRPFVARRPERSLQLPESFCCSIHVRPAI